MCVVWLWASTCRSWNAQFKRDSIPSQLMHTPISVDAYTDVRIHNVHSHTHTYTHTYIHTYIHTYMHTYVTYIYTSSHICTYSLFGSGDVKGLYTYIQIYLLTHSLTCLLTYLLTHFSHTYILTCIHTYMHTYIHTYRYTDRQIYRHTYTCSMQKYAYARDPYTRHTCTFMYILTLCYLGTCVSDLRKLFYSTLFILLYYVIFQHTVMVIITASTLWCVLLWF